LAQSARFVGWAVLIAGSLALLGWQPTMRLTGAAGVRAMLAGLGVALAASLVAMVPVARARSAAVGGRGRALLWSSLLRFVGTLAVSLGVVLGGWVVRGPFLIWVALGYLALLVADSAFAMRVLGGAATAETKR
jgi:hypothetical protein